MEDLQALAVRKADELNLQINTDPRWELEDELLCQVYGFTSYGYIFGFSRIHAFMDVEDIHLLITDKLIELGIGKQYAKGLVETAQKEFFAKNGQSLYSRLIDIGHSHALKENIPMLVDSIFNNAESIRNSMSPPA